MSVRSAGAATKWLHLERKEFYHSNITRCAAVSIYIIKRRRRKAKPLIIYTAQHNTFEYWSVGVVAPELCIFRSVSLSLYEKTARGPDRSARYMHIAFSYYDIEKKEKKKCYLNESIYKKLNTIYKVRSSGKSEKGKGKNVVAQGLFDLKKTRRK